VGDKVGFHDARFSLVPISKGSHRYLFLQQLAGFGHLYRDRALKLGPQKGRNPDSLLARPKERGDMALILKLGLAGEARLTPVQHGVELEPIRADLGYPGLTVAFCADGLKTDLSRFKLTQDEALDGKLQELRQTIAGVVEERLPLFKTLKARETYDLHPIGTLSGLLVALAITFQAGFLLKCLVIAVTASLGWLAERHYRREEIREARNLRTEKFREEILRRLGVDGGV